MDKINAYNQISQIIDQYDDEAQLHQFQKTFSNSQMQREFWKQRDIVLTTKDSLEKRKALAKLQWLQQFFGCSIPSKSGVKEFFAPNGLYGIMISPEASVYHNCTILQNVYIGANTFVDSDNAGFPVIGENVYIGAGAKIVGNVVIGNNVRIDDNCLITFDVPENSYVKNSNCQVIQPEPVLNNTPLSVSQFMKFRYDHFFYEYHKDDDYSLTVEKAVPEDIDLIFNLYKERINWFKWKKQLQWRYYLISHTREDFEKKIADGNYYLVKHNGNVAAGFVISTDSENWNCDSDDAFYLSRVVSNIGYKNMGEYIVNLAKSITLAAGKRYLRLECVNKNTKLNDIWNGRGFAYISDHSDRYHYTLREWDSLDPDKAFRAPAETAGTAE